MMSFNSQKCEFLRVTNKRNPILHNYYIENALIKEVSSATYLGITIDSKLTWNNHIHRIVNIANQIEIYATAQATLSAIVTKVWLDLLWNMHHQFW